MFGKFAPPPSEIICILFLFFWSPPWPPSEKFYEDQSQIFFKYKNQLIRWFLCISNVFLGYFGNYYILRLAMRHSIYLWSVGGAPPWIFCVNYLSNSIHWLTVWCNLIGTVHTSTLFKKRRQKIFNNGIFCLRRRVRKRPVGERFFVYIMDLSSF